MTLQNITHMSLVRYFSLRPSLSWSLFSLVLLVSLLFIVRWSDDVSDADLKDFSQFEMVEISLPKGYTQPDIDISEKVTEQVVEEKKEEKEQPLRFGNESGVFGDIFNTAKAPRPIYSSLPKYPASMRKAGIEGAVVIEVGVNEDGKLLYGKIIKTLGREFDLAVIRWVKTIGFYPAVDKEGKPIRCRIRLPIRFNLE